ncbi:MAG: aspartyl/asparaginyl beta-hydroxylase domain-containing protein [bacterium]|nr:aspartyl/asparaginyl beta-hydroxylase domain-containing protein [bacterium]
MSGFFEPERFGFTAALEAAWSEVRDELEALGPEAFVDAPDSLTTVEDGYDERGWTYFDLYGPGDHTANRARCPRSAALCEEVPGLVNAGFSRFRAGTHLYPHAGEIVGVLRCHLPLIVPDGDLGLAIGDETRRWQEGRCLVFDDTLEHTAWNRGDGDRVVLLVTFERPATAVTG